MLLRPAPLAGLAVLLGALWLLPLGHLLGHFPAHMVRHMGLVALAAPLAVLALPGLRIAAPGVVLGAAAEFAVVWGWHLPAARGLVCASPVAGVAEQASFLAAGVAVWAGALAAREPLAGAAGMLLTTMHMTLLGALLTLAPRDLYAAACDRAADLAAQQAGGMAMLAIGTPAYLLGGLWLVGRALGREVPA